MRIIQIGAGIQGIATTLDLAWNGNFEDILLADVDLKRADYVASLCNAKYGDKVRTTECDVTDETALVELLKGFDICINVVNYYFNTKIMDACLEAGVNYIDIGGLYVETIKQVKYDQRFKDAGLLAIIGIGGTPGLTNVCAAWIADQLDMIETIDFYCGCDDWTKTSRTFDVTYSIETIMDEFYMKPKQYIDNQIVELEPRSGGKIVQYANPIGSQYSYHIMHSEIGTIPESYRDKGLKNCTFRIGFNDSTINTLMFLHGLGFSKQEEIRVGDVSLKPVKVLKELMELQPKDANAVINDCDVIKIVGIGTKDGERVEYELEAICRPVSEWPELLGAQVYIGGAPAWAAELMRTGVIIAKGALGPELCIPPIPFFEEAAKREIYIRGSKKFLLGTSDWEAAARKEDVNQER